MLVSFAVSISVTRADQSGSPKALVGSRAHDKRSVRFRNEKLCDVSHQASLRLSYFVVGIVFVQSVEEWQALAITLRKKQERQYALRSIRGV